MTIKIRLIMSFFAMICLVTLVGIFFIYSGQMRMRYFQNAMQSTKISSLANEISYFLDQQLHSFDRYVLLNETKSGEDYEDFKKVINSKFLEWKNLVVDNKRASEEISAIENTYNDVLDSADRIVSLYRGDKGEKALNLAEKKYAPKKELLKENIRNVMRDKEKIANESQIEAEKIAHQQMHISIIVIVVSIVIGAFLSLYIFRFISKPLYSLQKGAEEIGSGNFDYYLELENKRDEFGKLAASFNEMTENIRKMQSQIIQLDRMSAMGQLAGGVAHELNNPLTGVLGQAQILLGKIDKDDENRSHIEKIERAAIRCRKIVRELLDFSRQKEYNFVSTDIHELIEATLLLCESDLAAIQISVTKEYSPDVKPIEVSQPHLQQIFLNLINNALHAMSPGGRLTISTLFFDSGYVIKDRRKNNQDINVPGRWLEVSFKDTGSGITSEDIQHIFDPFFTTKEIGKGTGLGLTISYGIIQNHKGTIFAESEGKGKGSVFHVRLPYDRKK